MDSNRWYLVTQTKPPIGVPLDLFHENWIDPDFTPTGVREGFLNDDGNWTVAIWNNDQDCWDAVNTPDDEYYGKKVEIPTHWKFRPQPPKEETILDNLGLNTPKDKWERAAISQSSKNQ